MNNNPSGVKPGLDLEPSGTWPVLRPANWTEFVNIVNGYVGSPSTMSYVFRGQADAELPLRPALIREQEPPLSIDRVLEIEQSLRADFQRVAQLHQHEVPHLPAEDDLMGWWTLMQHYGVPTRLLDWTESAYVAAYFAAGGAWDRPGAVWVFHAGELNRATIARGGPKTIEIPIPIVGVPFEPRSFLQVNRQRTPSHRSWAQQGAYTICTNATADHGDLLRDAFRGRDRKYWLKIIIAEKAKPDILKHLRAVNVTAAALFPGLDGAGRAGRELWRLEVGPSQDGDGPT